ncbi:MAG: glycosyl hydrolase [bacterium]|nr:glycosyl hydrolase [bacterium]
MNVNAFVNPPVDHRIIPFWFWNGTIEEGEIVRQIREMGEKGIGGFCLAAGPGLNTPYLSQVWFDRVSVALETADTFGLRVWLHDEYLNPDGMDNGRVTLINPQYRAHHLTFRETTVQGGQQVDMELPWATVLLAIAVPLRRDRSLWDDTIDIRKYLGGHQHQTHYRELANGYHDASFSTRNPIHRLYWKAPAGRWRVIVFLQNEAGTSEFLGVHFDPFNPDAVAQYLTTTYQPYLDRFKKAISGLLTVETVPSKDRLPWSPLLPEAFQDRNGYGLVKCLPALITGFGPNTARIRYDYFQTLGNMLDTSYQKVCAAWSQQHGMDYASTVSTLRNAHRQNTPILGSSGGREKVGANRLKDWEDLSAFYQRNPKFSSSIAHQTGQKRVLNTCFQDTGWALNLQDMKWIFDRQAALGANLFNPFGFSYTLDGLRKHHIPGAQFHQNPYWKHFRLLSDYAGRLSYALSQGRHVANIALLEPVTSLWTHLAHPGCNWEYVGYDGEEQTLTERLVSDWSYLMESLNQMQRPYDCLDPEMMPKAQVSGRRLELGDAQYDVLVIPPITNLERSAFEVLREFINAEGHVICMGLLPIEDIQEGPSVVEAFSRLTDMDPGRMIRDYTGHELGVHLVQRGTLHLVRTGGSIKRNQAATQLAFLLDKVLPRHIIVQASRKGETHLLCHHRDNGKQQLYFFANESVDAFEAQVHLQMPSTQFETVEKWDLETGKRIVLPAQKTGHQFTLPLTFAPLQSHLIVISESKTSTKVAAPDFDLVSLSLKGNWKIDPEEDNALRLDRFRMQIDLQNRGQKQGWHKPDYADSRWTKVTPKPFVEQLRDLSNLSSLPITLTESDDDLPVTPNIRLPLMCWFRTTFVADVVPSKLALVMDRGALLGNYQVYFNGSRLPSNAFRPTFRYDHNNVTCAIGRRVTKGKNVIAIRMEINDLTEGVVDAFYLFGKFRVKSWRNIYLRLVSPLERGPFHSLDNLGMPFYAGTVAYTKDFSFSKRPSSKQFVLNLAKEFKNFSDIVEVQINGHSLGVRPWTPYVWTGESDWLKQGKNRVTIRITNTLARLLTGREFQIRTHKMSPVKI